MIATAVTDIQLPLNCKDPVTKHLRPASRKYLKHNKGHLGQWRPRPNDV
jgi:hypothetical protein